MTRSQSQSQRQCARLAAELRLLRGRSGLTIAALAEESAYSRSSWQRYLSGAALPPWLAVRALCHLAGEPEPRIRALWELAEGAWSGRGAVASAPAPAPAPAPEPAPAAVPDPPTQAAEPAGGTGQPSGFGRLRTGAVTAALLLAATLGGAAARDQNAGDRASPAQSGASSASGFHVGCVGDACNGLDPGPTLCGVEPETLLHQSTPSGAGMEVRYNPLCRAAWARTWNTQLGDRLTLSEPGAPTQDVTMNDPHRLDAFAYTPLVALTGSGTSLKVCLTTPSPRSATCYSLPSPSP
ncbi:hypothetical protein ABIA33_000463 [Streptacidiphilus sp. MAP12-16]|uniref:helix-turn-helix domain-containing protein n=1 Tax=Streptacidiphilus sp. MAP12-16 TaxID=3156300 RepID=UPI0035173CBC